MFRTGALMECLETGKICPNTNKKCKICKLDSCREVLNMIEIFERLRRNSKEEQLKKELPKECNNCSLLEVVDLNKKKVKCFYRMNGKCTLKER